MFACVYVVFQTSWPKSVQLIPRYQTQPVSVMAASDLPNKRRAHNDILTAEDDVLAPVAHLPSPLVPVPNPSMRLKLNVGGQCFETTAGTLKQIVNTVFADLLATTPLQEGDVIYFDRSPEWVEAILEYLRDYPLRPFPISIYLASGKLNIETWHDLVYKVQIYNIEPLCNKLTLPSITEVGLPLQTPAFKFALFQMLRYGLDDYEDIPKLKYVRSLDQSKVLRQYDAVKLTQKFNKSSNVECPKYHTDFNSDGKLSCLLFVLSAGSYIFFYRVRSCCNGDNNIDISHTSVLGIMTHPQDQLTIYPSRDNGCMPKTEVNGTNYYRAFPDTSAFLLSRKKNLKSENIMLSIPTHSTFEALSFSQPASTAATPTPDGAAELYFYSLNVYRVYV